MAELAKIKKEKFRTKTAFTKQKNALRTLIENEASVSSLRRELTKLHCGLEEAMAVMLALEEIMADEGEEESMKLAVVSEMEQLDRTYDEMDRQVRDFSIQNKCSTTSNSFSKLKPIEIPIFDGDSFKYSFWRAAFYACIHSSDANAEIKLLHLRQYLKGQPLKYVEQYNFNEDGYKAALEKLDEKYGGERRRILQQLEIIANIKPVRNNNLHDLNEFVDVLDVFVTNISSSSDASELNSKSTLYSIKKKLPESLILSFERFLVNDKSNDSIEYILTWLKNETNLRNIANEMVKGVKEDKFKDKHSVTLFL